MHRVLLVAACFVPQLACATTELTPAELALDDACSAVGASGGDGACAVSALQSTLKRAAPMQRPIAQVGEAAAVASASSHGTTLANTMAQPAGDAAVSRGAKLQPLIAQPLIESRIGCPRFTGGTCSFLGCGGWRNSSCINKACLCGEGTCSNQQGVCTKKGKPKCKKDQGDSCYVWDCADGASCSSDYSCKCNEGTCASHLGTCEKPDTCLKDTGGTCSYSSCNPDRGNTKCVEGKCECLHGFCAEDRGDGYGTCTLKPHPFFLAEVRAVNQDHPTFPAPHDQVSMGLSFSGGGARALSWAMGGYRALEDLGLMQYVDAISSVSGGTWASSVYMFANRSKENLLGSATKPEELTMEVLNSRPPAMGHTVTTSIVPFLTKVVTDNLPTTQLWPLLVGEQILKPFGLDSRSTFLAGSAEEVDRIRTENPALKGLDFVVPQPERPKVFIMNGVMIAPDGFMGEGDNMVMLQMSPDFTGSPFWPGDGQLPRVNYEPAKNGGLSTLKNVVVGGGFVETFAFGGEAPLADSSQSGGDLASLEPPPEVFTLTDAVGISSVAPASLLAQVGKYQFVVPQARIWPVMPEGQTQPAQKYKLGDGGSLENAGFLPLLQRGADRATLFISTYIELGKDVDFCTPAPGTDWDKVFGAGGSLPSIEGMDMQVAPMVSALFGYNYEDVSSGTYYGKNQVFERSELLPVLCELQTLKNNGKPTVYMGSHMVKRNSWWGIKGGSMVKILIVYLGQCTDFEKALPADTQADIGPKSPSKRSWKSSGQWARYPDYSTTFQTNSQVELVQLTPGEVNLLSAQSEYFVRQNEDKFREMFCPQGVSGLCCRNPTTMGCNMMR